MKSSGGLRTLLLKRAAIAFVAAGLVGSAAFLFTYHALTDSYPPAGFLLVGEAELARQFNAPEPPKPQVSGTEKAMTPRERQMAKVAYEGVLGVAALIAGGFVWLYLWLYWRSVNETRRRTKERFNKAVFGANSDAQAPSIRLGTDGEAPC